ncbi:hypothetical protein ACFV16_02265 [Streptomyces massasporeus]|uniref:hypothetical protein n=1 Tax=Streptomyces massasporeus TaxID=67324 RepID=UPI00367E6B84
MSGRTKTVTDAPGITKTYTYDNRDRIRTVTSPNTVKVEYGYDGDGNLVQRSDGTGTTKYEFDPLQRETVRHLQDGSQTLLAYTPACNVDYYQDPGGATDYTWNEVNKCTELKDPQGKITKYGYNNDARNTKRTYSYDGAGRFSYAEEEKSGAVTDSWQYCYDLAGNPSSQGTARAARAGPPTPTTTPSSSPPSPPRGAPGRMTRSATRRLAPPLTTTPVPARSGPTTLRCRRSR